MRNFWKRANRGLLLGGVLLLGTVCYVGIDYFRFSHGKDDMEQVLRSYVTDLAGAAVTPESQAAYNHQKAEAEKEAVYKALGDVIRAYWTDAHDSSDGYYIFKSDVLSSMHEVAYSTDLPGYVSSYTANISNIKFRKNGPGAASFSMSAEYVVETYGSCCFPTLEAYNYSLYDAAQKTDGNEFTDTDEDDIDTAEDNFSYYEGTLRSTGTIYYYGELLYENGSWRISWMNSAYDSPSPFETVPQEGGN